MMMVVVVSIEIEHQSYVKSSKVIPRFPVLIRIAKMVNAFFIFFSVCNICSLDR